MKCNVIATITAFTSLVGFTILPFPAIAARGCPYGQAPDYSQNPPNGCVVNPKFEYVHTEPGWGAIIFGHHRETKATLYVAVPGGHQTAQSAMNAGLESCKTQSDDCFVSLTPHLGGDGAIAYHDDGTIMSAGFGDKRKAAKEAALKTARRVAKSSIYSR